MFSGEKKKKEVEWKGKVEFRKEEIPADAGSIHGHILTYSRLNF